MLLKYAALLTGVQNVFYRLYSLQNEDTCLKPSHIIMKFACIGFWASKFEVWSQVAKYYLT